MMSSEAAGTKAGKSIRASRPCANCQAEQQALYVLPPAHRTERRGSDVCFFCYLKVTAAKPAASVLLL